MKLARLQWMRRRLSRMPPAEIAWRMGSALRILSRRAGIGDARVAPLPASVDAPGALGPAWCVTGPVSAANDAAVRAAAEPLLADRLEVFGSAVPLRAAVPDWHADPVTGHRYPGGFGLQVDFRHLPVGVDIKHAWEVARHAWWVTLAQAWSVSGDRRSLDRLANALDSWLDQCVYPNGIHWSSAVEHGVRLINWSLTWHLAGGRHSPLFDGPAGERRLQRWLAQIFQHVHFCHDNRSRHTSSSNHLIGELAGIAIAVRTWDLWPALRPLAAQARAELRREAFLQFADDGINREQALSYHKFSLQFLLAAGLAVRGSSQDFDRAWWQRVEAGIVALAALLDARGHLPRIGDSDDGDAWRLALGAPDGYHELVAIGARVFSSAPLQAKCAALGPATTALADPLQREAAAESSAPIRLVAPVVLPLARLPTRFPDGGYVLLGHRLHQPDELRALMDCGPLGYNRICAHGHADALAVLVSIGGEPLLVDPGTYCYNAEPRWRRHFRGTASHNTLQVDGLDQSDYGGSFLWLRDIRCTVVEDSSDGGSMTLHAWHDGYERLPDPVRHHRRICVEPGGTVRVEDWLEARSAHTVALHWQAALGAQILPVAGEPAAWHLKGRLHGVRIRIQGPTTDVVVAQGQEDPPLGWVSPGFYDKQPAPALRARAVLMPGQRLVTLLEPVSGA
ncbi:MAG: alginate lyase family protein [Aquabacterium sp.]